MGVSGPTTAVATAAGISLGGGRLLIGRTEEFEELRAALAETRARHGALLVITGEPGIGKTALAEALAREAELHGVTAAWGRCWADRAAPAYGPWIQLLSALDPAAAALLDSAREATAPVRATSQSTSARAGLFRRVANGVRAWCAERPMLLVLDDLHSADEASLSLLRYLTGELPGLALLILATARDGAASENVGAQRRVPLRGLAERDVADLAEHHLGRRLALGLVRRIHDVTEGNPLFLDQLLRVRAAEEKAGAIGAASWELPIPRSVRDAIRDRLEPLSGEVVEVLSIAAVVGREVDAGMLAEVGGLDEASTAGALAQAADACLLERVGTDRFRFVHGLIRTELYERLAPARRTALHLRVARRLESDPGAPPASELAHHYRSALPRADAGLAVEWSWRAARAALEVLAYEDAAAHAAGALALGVTGRQRARLLLTLGEAKGATGAIEAARRAFREAASEARATGAADLLAQAALGFGATGGSGTAGGADGAEPDLAGLLEVAHATLTPDGDIALRASVLARLAEERVAGRDFARAGELSREAVSLARRGHDDAVLSRALAARLLATLPAAHAATRGELIAELAAAADSAGDPEPQLQAALWALNHGLEAGERADAVAARDRLCALARRTQQPHQLWYASTTQALLALLDGRLDDAERQMTSARREGQDVVAMAPAAYGIQLLAVRREQDRLAELEPLVRESAAARPAALSWRCAWIGLLADGSHDARAREELARLPEVAFTAPRDDYEWPARVPTLAEVSARLGETRPCAALYEALRPYAGQAALVAPVLCRGAVDRYLGLLAGTLGRRADAERHFDHAQELHRRLASPLWTARTELDRATLRATDDDLEGATAAARAALATAEELGLISIARRARALLSPRAPAPSAARTPQSPAMPRALIFVREGEVWAVGDPDAPVRLPDSRGLSYIAILLATPGEEHAAADLAGVDGGTGEPVLDGASKQAYRARLEALKDEIAAAEQFGDVPQADRARAEFDTIAEELARAVGLRGRDRRLTGPSERARSSVTKAIRAAIRRIAANDGALAQHLDGAVRTGTFCRYVPDAWRPIDWRVTM